MSRLKKKNVRIFFLRENSHLTGRMRMPYHSISQRAMQRPVLDSGDGSMSHQNAKTGSKRAKNSSCYDCMIGKNPLVTEQIKKLFFKVKTDQRGKGMLGCILWKLGESHNPPGYQTQGLVMWDGRVADFPQKAQSYTKLWFFTWRLWEKMHWSPVKLGIS